MTGWIRWMAIAALSAASAQGAELVVMSVGAVRSAFADAVPRWEASSGHRVRASFDPAGDVRKKIAAAQQADVIILPVESFQQLEHDGIVAHGSVRDLGGVAMAAAVRAGAPVPDVTSVDGLRRTLLAAKSVTYMDPQRGTSGKHFDETVLPRLGIRDEVRAKTTLGEGGYIAEKVASGDIEIAFHNLTEILPVKGITIAGTLPAELQRATVYSGAVSTSSKHPAEAQALLDYLASPAGRKSFLDRGFTAP